MEREWNEGLEPARLVLKLAQPDEMVDPVLGLVDVTVEHRGIGVKTQPVGRPMDVEPALGRRLGAADLLANFGMEDLGAAAGQAAEAGSIELSENILDGPAGDLAKPLDLDGRIRLDVNLGAVSRIQRTTST